MATQILVRPITERDISGFRDAVDAVSKERKFLRRFEAPPLEGVAAFVRGNIEKGNPQFVAIAGDAVVGWCDIVRSDNASENHAGVLGMGIMGPWRGQGAGRRLIDATLAAADAGGFLRISLSVHEDNTPAMALYQRSGFVEEGRQRGAIRKPVGFVDAILMARLQPAEHWQAPTQA